MLHHALSRQYTWLYTRLLHSPHDRRHSAPPTLGDLELRAAPSGRLPLRCLKTAITPRPGRGLAREWAPSPSSPGCPGAIEVSGLGSFGSPRRHRARWSAAPHEVVTGMEGAAPRLVVELTFVSRPAEVVPFAH